MYNLNTYHTISFATAIGASVATTVEMIDGIGEDYNMRLRT